MRSRYILMVVVLLVLVSVLVASAGNPDSPDVPGNTQSYTLDDIYNRINDGTAATQSTFTEPAAGPGTGTMHTLNEIYDLIGLRAPVPKTGQTGCWDAGGNARNCAGTGEDGEHQKGVTWPNPRFTKNNGTVTDNLTGLIWLKDANCIMTQYPGYDADGKVTWQQALQFVAGINDGTYPNCRAGHTDWRLPNVRELSSLAHYGVWKPAVPNTAGTAKWSDGDPFTGVEDKHYWSSTTAATNEKRAWCVGMRHGIVDHYFKSDDYYVWPVRGGQ